MIENGEQKRATKLKKIFKSQLDAQVSPLQRRTPINHLEISSPILQHSTSIFSLVTPTNRTVMHSINTSDTNTFELYQPHSPPPPIPQSSSPWSPSSRINKRSKTVGHSATIIEEEETRSQKIPFSYSDPGQKNKIVDEKTFLAQTKPATRRHSCSSAISIQKQPPKQFEIIHFMTLRKLRDWHRHSSKVGCENPVSVKGSKSTPTNKLLKAYNVSRMCVTDATSCEEKEREKKKKMQEELEDLITGRRTSTLKLSLTPEGLC